MLSGVNRNVGLLERLTIYAALNILELLQNASKKALDQPKKARPLGVMMRAP